MIIKSSLHPAVICHFPDPHCILRKFCIHQCCKGDPMPNKKRAVKTSYLFPSKGAVSVVEIPKQNTSDKYTFGMLEIDFGDEDWQDFAEIHLLLRQSQAISVTHTPGMADEEDPEKSNLVLSFHATRNGAEQLDDPVMMMVLPLDTMDDAEILNEFNERIDRDGYFALIIHLQDHMMFLGLAEVFAVAPRISNAQFKGALSIFIGEFKYYAEHLPPLPNAVDGILLALEHYRNHSSPNISSGAVDLTGLIPDGLA
jgi:hypothetical protein